MHLPHLPKRQPRRIAARTLGLGASALLAAGLLAWAPSIATGWNQSGAEGTLWQLLNADRANNGVRLLQQHGTLVSLARWRSQDMVQRNYFDHTVLGSGYQVFHWYDINGLSYVWGGENIGWNAGYSDADSPVAINNGFMASAGHRSNILQPSWTHGGVGAYGADNVNYLGQVRNVRMYTELFMQARAAAPAPPPPPAPPAYQPPAPPPAPGAAPPAAPAAAAAPKPKPQVFKVAAPSRPAAAKLGSATPVVRVPSWWTVAEPIRALRYDNFDASPTLAPQVASVYRVQPSSGGDRGLVETILGSLLGFFLG